MQCYLAGEASTRIVIAISNDPAFREETYQSMVFASKASTISMGYDKMGRKSRSKTNVSVIKEDEEDNEDEEKVVAKTRIKWRHISRKTKCLTTKSSHRKR